LNRGKEVVTRRGQGTSFNIEEGSCNYRNRTCWERKTRKV